MTSQSLSARLRILPGARLWSSDADRADLLGPLPDGVTAADELADANLAVLWAEGAAGLRRLLDAHRSSLGAPAILWVAYPKGNRTDLNRDSLWPMLTEHGLRPVAQVSIDGTWSALRFRPLREGEAPFTGGR